MDRPDVDPRALERSLRFIRRVNRFLGYTRASLGHLQRFSRRWEPGQTIRILDVATGSADIPVAIARWAEGGGFNVRITGIDRHAITARTALAVSPHPRVSIVQGDALALPFADRAFDYGMTSSFLHHLDDDVVVQVLREMERVTARGLIVADQLRHRRAYLWIRLLTMTSDPIVRHDASVTVGQSFTKSEAIDLSERAGIGYARYHRHFGHRFVLAGERDA
jgi:SAM-dependent methyltransferase